MLWNNIMSHYFAEGDIYIIMQAWQLFSFINTHVKWLFNQHSLRKQTTFHGATTGFHVKWWCLQNKCRNSILMMHHYQDLGSASDWSCCMGNLLQPKHYPDLGSDASSVWNFCARFLEIISQGKPVVVLWNVSCYLWLQSALNLCIHQ